MSKHCERKESKMKDELGQVIEMDKPPIVLPPTNDRASDRQVGGSHYKDFPIQPVEFTHANGLNFLQGCIIKRITRYNQEGGKGREDLEKIKHEVDLLLEMENL